MTRPKKRFGQHFLEPAWVAKTIAAIAPRPEDVFVEIGPGPGALTRPLTAAARRVIAIEVDRDLADALTRASIPNLQVVNRDVLDVDYEALLAGEPGPVRVAGNLPYNISSPILFGLIAAARDGARFSDATLMVQKEVADRMAAPAGSRDYGVLAVQTALVADVDLLFTLPPGAFRPPPAVTSAVVRLRFRPPPVEVGDRALFARVVRTVFQQRRKTLANGLKPLASPSGPPVSQLLERASVDGAKRPEALDLDAFARLTRAML